MKSILALLAACFACLSTLEAGPTNQFKLTLGWTYHETNELNTFILYGSTNVAAPKPWLYVTNVPGTNFTATFLVEPGEMYFYATTSNFWGRESDYSETLALPSVPKKIKLNIWTVIKNAIGL